MIFPSHTFVAAALTTLLATSAISQPIGHPDMASREVDPKAVGLVTGAVFGFGLGGLTGYLEFLNRHRPHKSAPAPHPRASPSPTSECQASTVSLTSRATLAEIIHKPWVLGIASYLITFPIGQGLGAMTAWVIHKDDHHGSKV
ncbi:hypothetical protein OC861_006111 [Tilletia horrida]|nr:hypothetical protein OC861_006111 [Tilletia horrida]